MSQHSLPQHGNLILDAALLPLQSLLGDAFHCKHTAGQLLLGQDHLWKCPSVNTYKLTWVRLVHLNIYKRLKKSSIISVSDKMYLNISYESLTKTSMKKHRLCIWGQSLNVYQKYTPVSTSTWNPFWNLLSALFYRIMSKLALSPGPETVCPSNKNSTLQKKQKRFKNTWIQLVFL